MSRLPVVSGQDCVAALCRAGFYVRRRESSHIIMRRDEPFAQVSVPDHRVIARGTLRAILKQAGLSAGELIRLLHD